MNSEELRDYLASTLGETRESVIKAIEEVTSNNSEAYCMKLLEDAYRLHNAGILIQDGTRPRTLGGCFFMVHRFRQEGKL